MTKIKVDVSSALQSKLNKMVLETKKELAKDARDKLVEATHKSMLAFYAHYTPKRYKRTRGFRDNSFVGVYKNPHNSRIYGGVRLTTEKLNASNYHTFVLNLNDGKWERADIEPGDATSNASPKDILKGKPYPKTMGDIRELVYTGHHGNAELFDIMHNHKRNITIPPVMNPSPYDVIINAKQKYLDNIHKKNEINKIARKFWK